MGRRTFKKRPQNGFLKNAGTFVKGVGTVASIVGKALSVATTIAGLVNAEHKHVDTLSTWVSTNATPRIDPLTNMAQGSTDVTRNGNSILAKHVYIKGDILRNPSAAATAIEGVRVMLIMDTNDENDVPPTIDFLLQNYSTGYAMVSHHNKNYTDRFKVLFDKAFYINAQVPSVKFKYYKAYAVKTYTKQNGAAKIISTHMTYNGPVSTDLSKNHLYLVTIGSTDTNAPTTKYHVRFGYTDN